MKIKIIIDDWIDYLMLNNPEFKTRLRRSLQDARSGKTAQKPSTSSKNLWDNPPPASEELKLTVAEFKDNYNRSEPWDGDFAA